MLQSSCFLLFHMFYVNDKYKYLQKRVFSLLLPQNSSTLALAESQTISQTFL